MSGLSCYYPAHMKKALLALSLAVALPSFAGQGFYDRMHTSRVFGEPRMYRIFLPPDYDVSGKSYPVIYYFHGHSDRYTLEQYDNGTDTVPKIADFVSGHDVIVVSVDGYVAKDYTGFYGGRPWDVDASGGDMDFGLYFLELVEHIDAAYRTLTDRRHRATSGLSMGGFMSLYLSARFPDTVGSASSFNPGPEFYVGDRGRRVLWRPKDHVSNHAQAMIRLIRASGDYISQYHEETREAYARTADVDFEYRQDEYHKHWATSIAESFSFHMRAFENPRLSNVPEEWSHAEAYSSFRVWGYRVEAPGNEPCIVHLSDVRQGGFRITTRRWAPDGPPVAGRRLTVTTAPIYKAGSEYTIQDLSLASGSLSRTKATADETGRITLTVDGSGHQVSFVGPGTGAQPPVLLPLTSSDVLRLPPSRDVRLPVRIYNPRGTALENVKVVLESDYPTVRLARNPVEIPGIQPGGIADLSDRFSMNLTSGAGYFAPARLRLRMTYDGWYESAVNIDTLVIPEILPEPAAAEVLDGRTFTFRVFRQRGNQGGGDTIERQVTEGKGNGNGILEPGEEATIWVLLVQGMDPFDKNTWHRCKIYAESPWITEVADIEEEKQREWTSACERTSLIQLSASAPHGTEIPLLLSSESWSFHYTPDVRYGPLPLYQAFQLHTRHLHKHQLRVP
jgi:predicted alpha/beta superfamily hydrolase